ncbi:uncharacterized protein EDB93DRAFT_1106399 [Suillus bovinus]|uniref:uncharacterized protein n=1 Tax=Suillus bovinus TaxID=48563 RepID=UPI001B862D35|nr:uncharacterized protein EDB93DRAFT_1106399 [Suillus bovinus]KAG2138441.1 hypothetical protein EDB93DRAFT_1106399 [Suillus bovinus]
MFTSRFAILTLLTFLAGVNANGTCAMCDDTVDFEGVALYTLANSTVETNGYTLCKHQGDMRVFAHYLHFDTLAVIRATAYTWMGMNCVRARWEISLVRMIETSERRKEEIKCTETGGAA